MPFILIHAGFNTASGKHYCNWRIMLALRAEMFYGFNTASGKHYCNSRPYKVSIHGA